MKAGIFAIFKLTKTILQEKKNQNSKFAINDQKVDIFQLFPFFYSSEKKQKLGPMLAQSVCHWLGLVLQELKK